MTGDTPAHTTDESWCQNSAAPFACFVFGQSCSFVGNIRNLQMHFNHFKRLYGSPEKAKEQLGQLRQSGMKPARICLESFETEETKTKYPYFDSKGNGKTLAEFLAENSIAWPA